MVAMSDTGIYAGDSEGFEVYLIMKDFDLYIQSLFEWGLVVNISRPAYEAEMTMGYKKR